MASKRRVRRRSCEKKRRHQTVADAKTAVDHARRKHGVDKHVYSCQFCGGWHIGR